MQPHTGLHFVDVLSACTRASESVPTYSRRVDLHLDGVINQWHDKHARKTRHALSLRIIRTHAHQTVHAVLALEITVRHVAFDIERHGLDSCLIAFLQVGDSHFIIVLLAVPLVHTHQLFCPVLSLGTACPRDDLQHRRHLVLFVTQHILHLQVLNLRKSVRISRIHLFFGHQLLAVVLITEVQLLHRRAYTFVSVDPSFDALHLAHLRLGSLGVIPESRSLRMQLFFLQLDAFLVDLQVRFQLVRTLLYVF